jgi:hypothetical protein
MRILVRQFENGNQLGKIQKLLLISLLVVLPITGLSQNGSSIFSKVEFETGMAPTKAALGAFNVFSKNLNPSIYIENNVIKVQEANATCLYIDHASIGSIDVTLKDKKSVQYIAVRIKKQANVKTNIDLSKFSNFVNLKFIHVIFEYEISDSEIKSIINVPPMDCNVIYESRKIM